METKEIALWIGIIAGVITIASQIKEVKQPEVNVI